MVLPLTNASFKDYINKVENYCNFSLKVTFVQKKRTNIRQRNFKTIDLFRHFSLGQNLNKTFFSHWQNALHILCFKKKNTVFIRYLPASKANFIIIILDFRLLDNNS